MLKESTQVIRHFWLMEKLFDVKRGIIWSLLLMVLFGLLMNVNVFFKGMFYGVAGVAMGETLYAFACACIKEYLEKTSIQLGNFDKIQALSSEEMFNILKMDAKVHEEVVAAYKDEWTKECEEVRYLRLRSAHFAVWFSKNMDRVSAFCESSDFDDLVLFERFKAEQAGYFDELAKIFSNHGSTVNLIREGEKLVKSRLDGNNILIPEYQIHLEGK